ncbi:MAG: 3-deoxy-7-phosphoheptulonate synthase [Spirochaetia bacterium]
MIIILQKDVKTEEKFRIREFLVKHGFKVKEIVGEEETIFGAVGQMTIDHREVLVLPGVDRVIPISKPYKLASRELKKEDTIINIGPVKIGGARITVIAGPCAIESRESILEAAYAVRESGAVMLRGGAFKPRTSPYSFQGLGEEGLRYLKEAGDAVGIPVATEIVSTDHIPVMSEYVDVFQIGARNMQNFELLKKVGALGKPVILKRGLSATIQEWLMAAEYLMAHGTDDVILCERGIRTFETYTRNTLDLSAIPVVKKLSHLPVIVDPSHATGIREKVPPMGLAAVAAGADGLLVEVHPRPEKAMSDGAQSLYPEQFEKLMRDVEALSPVVGKEVARLPKSRSVQISVEKAISEDVASPHLQVAFQGERGAFSEMAAEHFFSQSDHTALPQQHFKDVFETVLAGDADFGIVPIENSLAGSIHENYDLLLQYPDIHIVGEQKIRIEHCLIGLPEAEIAQIGKVFSHPQGLAQCADFLEEHPSWQRVPFYDTAGSVAHIAAENTSGNAAIASRVAAEAYNMQILKEGIETNPRNYTKFFIIARKERDLGFVPNMVSFVFSTPDEPGALFACLKVLTEAKLNMKKLESRPIQGKPWQYMFYVDVEIPSEDYDIAPAIQNLKEKSRDLRVLGQYRS